MTKHVHFFPFTWRCHVSGWAHAVTSGSTWLPSFWRQNCDYYCCYRGTVVVIIGFLEMYFSLPRSIKYYFWFTFNFARFLRKQGIDHESKILFECGLGWIRLMFEVNFLFPSPLPCNLSLHLDNRLNYYEHLDFDPLRISNWKHRRTKIANTTTTGLAISENNRSEMFQV